MSTHVHPTAVVGPRALLGDNVRIGPYCVISDKASIGDGTTLDAYVRVHANTTLGRSNRVQAFTALGGDPEDLKYQGEECFLVIGDNNDFREHVTINRGTAGGGHHTRVGNGCLFQNKVHVGHDCQVGDDVIISATTAMAGHVELEDRCIVGGGSLIHQFCRVGTGAMVGFGSMLSKSVPPFSLYNGTTGVVDGANIVGLRRRGLDNASVRAVAEAVATLYDERQTLQERAQTLLRTSQETDNGSPQPSQVADIADFVLNRLGSRGLAEGRVKRG